MSKELGKKINIQNDIDERGQALFLIALPHNEEFSLIFSDQQKDKGIDGELQVFVNQYHTGEFLKVQLKSMGEGKYIEERKFISFPLDLDSAFFLIKQVQTPVALIVVDNKAEKVFWHPIQTDVEAVTKLEQRLIEPTDAKNPSITIRIDTNNELSPLKYDGIHRYINIASLKLSKQRLLETRSSETLTEGLSHIEDVESQILNLEGFTWKHRQGDTYTPGTMFSISASDGTFIDYIPNENYKPELVPTVKLKTRFSTKSKTDKRKYDAFKKLVEKGEGEVELDGDNLELIEMVSGKQVIGRHSSIRMHIQTGPSKMRRTILLSNGVDEFEMLVDIWGKDGNLHIETAKSQHALSISLVHNVNTKLGDFKINVNTELLGSVTEELKILDFLKRMQSGSLIVSFIDPSGFKRRLFEAGLNNHELLSDARYNFIKALAEMEQKTGVAIPYPLPEKVTPQHISNAFWVHKLITQGKVKEDLTVRFTIDSTTEPITKGHALMFTYSPPEIYLFDKPYFLPDFTHTIKGTIDEVKELNKKGKVSYKVRMKNAENEITKKEISKAQIDKSNLQINPRI